ncbi:hypothetical protein O181_045370 [Austropuccinia psidii MF-1]|uniref:Uncharacterized protein n=1 Tax=Austropuccinia psidii MF-1 TaxID=1389203 RepID=A0A9Q3DRA9_9BASI|nr:hypothetical protein [Austropuccinia psidii MF-1]
MYTSGSFKSQGNSQRTDNNCSEPDNQGLYTIVNGRTQREIIPMLPFTSKFVKNLKLEDWRGMDQVLQIHQLLKYLLQWRMEYNRLKLVSHLAELRAGLQKIFLKEIPFKDLMVITKGWNPNRQFKLLEERASRIRANNDTIQTIEYQMNQTEHTLIPSDSQGGFQPDSSVASNHSGTSRLVAKSHHYSQSQVISRRRQGSKGKNKTSLNQRQK